MTPAFSLSRGSKRLPRSRPFLDRWDQDDDDEDDDNDEGTDDGPVTLQSVGW